jgi:hypothetical protein
VISQERQCTYKVTSRRVHETSVAVGKQYVLYIYLCVCVRVGACVYVGGRAHGHVHVCARVALIIEHGKLSVASLAPPNSSTLSHKRHDFRKKDYLI